MEERWSLPDLDAALQWCRQRKDQHIRCTLAVIGEYARTPDEAQQAVALCREAIRSAGGLLAGTSVSVKPSALGLLFDQQEYLRNLSLLFHEALDRGTGFEIDMEGRPLAAGTFQSALWLAREGGPLIVGLQAYLDRTASDLAACMAAGVTVRLVKGAYLGDTADVPAIRERFRNHAEKLIAGGIFFCAATHDPLLLSWLTERMQGKGERIEFGFLKGLSDRTKQEMAADGWRVSEYVPYGTGGRAYVLRRERYLEELHRHGLSPAP